MSKANPIAAIVQMSHWTGVKPRGASRGESGSRVINESGGEGCAGARGVNDTEERLRPQQYTARAQTWSGCGRGGSHRSGRSGRGKTGSASENPVGIHR